MPQRGWNGSHSEQFCFAVWAGDPSRRVIEAQRLDYVLLLTWDAARRADVREAGGPHRLGDNLKRRMGWTASWFYVVFVLKKGSWQAGPVLTEKRCLSWFLDSSMKPVSNVRHVSGSAAKRHATSGLVFFLLPLRWVNLSFDWVSSCKYAGSESKPVYCTYAGESFLWNWISAYTLCDKASCSRFYKCSQGKKKSLVKLFLYRLGTITVSPD